MGASDGTIIGTTKIVDNGPASKRWNLVIMSEGYRLSEMGQFAGDARQIANELFLTPPFIQLKSAINIYRVDVASTDSGADDPIACGGSGAAPATFFDASFCTNGIRRLLVVDNIIALTVANAQVPEHHMVMVVVNSSEYGGSGGSVAVISQAPAAMEIALHEMGHTAFSLADEYEYYRGCGSGETGHDRFSGGEPFQPNITIDTNRATNKWRHLVSAATPMPTTRNANCAQCDPQPSPVPAGVVGAFEGAGYFHCNIFRPEYDCRMRALGSPFCAVCQERILKTLSPFNPPPPEE
jgi:IgA Peptidase M64